MTAPVRSRLAPTPSGFLHLGNLANFLLTERLVAAAKGTLALRIDDCDGTRSRPEFVEHVFDTLRWMGIEWQEGPRDAAEFYAVHSQVKRKEHYFLRLKEIGHLTYACACSRRDLETSVCLCRSKNLELMRGERTLRLHVKDPVLAAEFGDIVLWRKDDGPAYQWASVIDDLEMNVNLIVRGDDLRSSSELQKHIAALVQPGGFSGIRFVHHPLLFGAGAEKLSKSKGALSVRELIAGGATPESLRARVAEVIHGWGF